LSREGREGAKPLTGINPCLTPSRPGGAGPRWLRYSNFAPVVEIVELALD